MKTKSLFRLVRKGSRNLAIAIVTLLAAQSAQSATIYWDSTGTNLWSNAASWWTSAGGTTNPGSAPGSADTAIFNGTGVNGSTIVQLSAATSIAGMIFNNTGSTLIDSDSATLRNLAIGSGGITIDAGAGALTLGDAINPMPVWLAASQVWTNNSPVNALTVLNPIYNGTSLLTVGGAGNTTLSGAITAGAGGITKNGAGTLTLSGTNTFTGAVTANAGTLLVTGGNAWTGATTLNNGGTLQFSGATGANTGASAYTLNLGSSLIMDNTTAAGGNNNTRIADGSAFTLNGGSLIFKGTDVALTNSTETIQNIAGVGNSIITVTFGGTNVATLTAGSFAHAAGNATNLVNGVNLGMDSTSTASVARLISGTPTLVGTTVAINGGINAAVKNTQIVPFLVGEATSTTGGLGTATGTANTFVTYVAGTGYRPLNLTDEFTQDLITAGTNTRLTTGTTTAGTAAINSLVMEGGTLTITDGQTLTDSSGAILFTSTSAINPSSSTGALTFATIEPQITVTSGITGTISTNISGSAGLTKSGAGTLILSGSVANAYTGTTTVNAGTLQLGKSGAVQALSGALTIGSTSSSAAPVVQYTGASTDMMGTGAVTINSAGQLDFNGKSDIIGAITINATGATGNTTPIKNTAGSGTLTITTLAITPVAGFNSLINTNGGTLTLGGNVTFTAASTGQAQISGNLALGGANRTFTVGAGSGAGYDLLIDAVISGNNALIKDGAGVLKLQGANTFNTAGMNVNAGTVISGANDVLPNAGTIAIGSGANSATVNLNDFNDTIQGVYFGVANLGTTSTLTTGLGTLTISGAAGPNGHHLGTDSGSAMTKIISGKLDFAGGAKDISNSASAGDGGFTINAIIQNGGVIQNGGTVKYTGASTYASGTTLTSGVFQVGAASAGVADTPTSGPLGTGTVTFNGGGISSDSTAARTILNPVAFNAAANGVIGNAVNNGTLTFAGGMNLNTNGHTVTVNSAALITGTITGSGTITKAGTGMLTITPTTSNNYTGSLIAAGGILRPGATNAFSTTGDIGASGSGTVDLNGFDVTVNNLRFIVNAAGETSSIVTGSNTLTLNGGMNQFDSVSPGSRLLSGNLKLGTGNHAISGSGGAALTISALITGTDATSALSNTTQIVILNNANTYQGGTNVNGGTMRVGINSNGTGLSVTNGAFGTGTLTLTSGTVSSDGTTARSVGNAITFAGNINLGDTTNSGKLTFGADANLGAAARTLTVNSDVQFDGILSNGGLTKAGAGTLTLTGINTYTTVTTVSAGKLILTGSNSAATGGMTLSGGVTQFNSLAAIPGTTRNVTVTGPGAIVFGSAFETGTDIPTALLTRVVAGSTGAVAVDNYAATDFDFSAAGLTNASLGAVGTVTYTGTTNALTPSGTIYRLGGGGGTLVFTPVAYTNTNDLVINGNSNTGTVDFGGLSKSFGAINFAGGTAQNGTLTGTSFSGTGGTVTALLSGSGIFTNSANTTTLNANNSSFSGAVNITGGTLKAINAGSLGTGTVTISNGVGLTLNSDGTGTGLGNGKQESISYGNAVVLSGATQTITLGQLTAPAGTNTLNAVNKTLQLGTLATGAGALTVTNSNKFGLEFTGTTTLSGAAGTGTTFSIGTANVSSEVFGLTLNGLASDATTSAVNGATILTKSGAGTLLLKGTNATFGGNGGATGQIINIAAGYLAAPTDAALGATGATGNMVQISGNSATSGFLATGTFSTDRTFKLNAASNGIDVTQGNTLTLTTPFSLSGVGNALQKNDDGVLAIGANNSTWTGILTIPAGAVKVSNIGALGTAAGNTVVSNNIGAAVQLDALTLDTLTVAEPFSLSNTGINTGGALQALGGTLATPRSISTSGVITLANAATIGADAYTTLNIGTSSMVGTAALTLAGAGNINIGTALPAFGSITKIGGGVVDLTAASTLFVGGLTVNAGTFKLDGTTSKIGGTGAISVTNGAALTVDNTAGNVDNRLGGRAITLAGATLNLTGNGATAETLGTITAIGSGLTTINTNTSGTLKFASQTARNVGGVVNVVSGGTSSVQFGTALPGLTPASTGILPGWFVGNEFASVTALNTGIAAFGSYTTGDLGAVVTTTATVKPSGAQTTVTTRTINALNLTAGIGATIGTGQILTLAAGGLINNGGGNISGGFLTPGAEFIAKYSSDGSISSAITSGNGLTKLGTGNLTLSAVPDTQFTVGSTQNSYTGTTTIDQGTLTLSGGNNTLNVNRVMVLNGGTLALGSNNQYVGSFTSNGTVEGSGGNVTGTGTLTTNAANGTFAGNLGSDAGALNLVKAGGNTLILSSANSTTGTIKLIGGGLTLKDGGTLLGVTGSPALTVNNATLTIDNTGTKDVADRISDSAAITMNGGMIQLNGRAQFNSTESIGAVTVNSGQASLSSIQGGTGVNSAQLTLASLTRNTGATVNIQRLLPSNTNNLGLIGSTQRIVVTAGQTTVGGIVPGVFLAERDFVSYTPGLGFGRLGTTGFPAYYSTSASVSLASAPSTGNVKLTLGGTVASGGQTINALNADVYDVTFAGANDVLTLTSGMYTNMQSHSIGTTAVRGVLTSGSSELFLNAWHNSGSGITVHSKITGANMLVLSSDGSGGNPPIRLTSPSNDYTGGTVVNSGPGITTILTLDNAGSPVAVPNATDPTKGLVLNNSQAVMSVSQGQIGSGNIVTLNGGSTLTLFGNNTLAGLVINSLGGTTTPTVNPGGSLTLTGNITSTPSNVAITPIISGASGGNLNFNGATRTVTVNAYTEGTYTNGATLVGLNISAPIQNGALTKEGAGLLQLSGSNVYTGTTTITTGSIQANSATAFSPYSSVSLANDASAILDLNTQSNTIGSLTGGGTTGGNVGIVGAVTLTLGGDNTSPSAYLGKILGTTGLLTKIGSGTQILAGANTITGLVTVKMGTLQIGNGTVGSLNGTTGNALTFNGTGAFNVQETGGSTQGMGALTFSAGDGTVQSTFNAASATLTFTSLAGRTAGATGNFITSGGTNGTSNSIILTGAGAGFINQGEFFNGADYASMNATGTYVRALNYASTGGDPNTVDANTLTTGKHVKLTTSPVYQNSITLLSLNLSGSGINYVQNPAQTLTLPGILKSGGGAATLSGGTALSPNAEFVVRTDTASDSLTISTPITTGQPLTKSGAGTLTLSAVNTYSGTTTINQGTLTLAGGNNTLSVNRALVVQNGGTLNIGSNNQYVGAISSAGTFENNGGTISGSGLLTTNGSSTTFGGNITGSVSLTKVGAGTMSLSSASDTTGTINVLGTGLTLLDGGALTNTGTINVRGATLTLNNTGAQNMTNRVKDTAPINLDAGVVVFNGRAGFNSTETLGAVTANTGVSIINAVAATGGSAELTLTSLTRSTGAELWLNQGASGSLGLVGNNSRIIVTGGPVGNLAPINGVVPGAFTNSTNDNYNLVGYVAGLGFGAFGSTGFPTYYSGLSGATSTSNVSGGGAVAAGGQTINSLGGSVQANVTFANANDVLTINSGMTVMQITTWGTTALRGRITSGTQELFIMHRDGNATPDPIVNSVITDNGNPVSLIVHTPRQDRGYYVHLTAPNTYTGGTFVNGGPNPGGISLDATVDGTVVIPAGGLTINNNGLVDMTGFQGQIDPTNVVTINGGGVLDLAGNNTLAGIVFNSNGGTVQPRVTPYNTITAGSSNALATYGAKTGILIITGSITSNPSNVAVTPLIDAGTLDLNGSTSTINVSALAEFSGANATMNQLSSGLSITSLIQNGGITKTGTGVLNLTGTNTFAGQLTVANGYLNVAAVNNVSTNGVLGNSANSVILGGSGTTGTLEYTGGNTSTTKPFTMASGGAGVFQVDSSGTALTLSALIDGSGGMSKSGLGTLNVGTVANSYSGKTSVVAGTLQYSTPLTNYDDGVLTGVAGPLGLPTTLANATIDLHPNTTFAYTGGQSPAVQSTNRPLNLAGSGVGLITLNGTGVNDTTFNFTGAITATGTGPRTVLIKAAGDRPVYNYSGGIPDMSDSSPVSMAFAWSSASSTSNGTINLKGVNTFTGPMLLTGGGNGGPGTLLIGGSVSSYVSNVLNVTAGGTGVLGGGNYAGNVTFASGTAATAQIYYASGANQTMSGAISGPGAITQGGTSTSTLTLSGTNSYTGVTTISGGTLQIAKQLSLYNNTPANWTAANIKVGIGATLALNVGGTGEFTTGDVTTVLTNLGGLGGAPGSGLGLQSGSKIAIDTANASPTTFTVADNIADSTGTGGGAIGLTKLGANTLELTGTNVYTGATNVNAGTLSVASTGTINATSGVSIGAANFNYNSATALSQPVSFSSTGGTLSGNGTLTPAVTVTSDNNLSPGNSAGTLNFAGGLTLAAGSIFNWENNTVNTLGTAGSNWDVANVTGGATTISSTATTGAKLKLMFTDALTNFTDSFWDSNKTWKFITGGVSATNLFDSTNIAVFINSVQQGLTNIITGQGEFSTTVSGTDLDLVWTASGGAPEIAISQGGVIASGDSKDFGSVVVGQNTSLIFTITNSGLANLNLTGTPDLVAVSGANASDFTVTAQPTTPVTSSGGTTTFTVQFAPTTTGTRNAVLTILNNDSDEGTFTINLSGTGTTLYAVWALANGLDGTAGKENGVSDNPDGDASINSVEFAFDTDPLNSASAPITYVAGDTVTTHGTPVILKQSGLYYAVFGRRTNHVAAGLTYKVQFSADMSGAYWQDSADTPTQLATDGVIDAVRVPYPLGLINSASGPKKARFFRVQVSIAP